MKLLGIIVLTLSVYIGLFAGAAFAQTPSTVSYEEVDVFAGDTVFLDVSIDEMPEGIAGVIFEFDESDLSVFEIVDIDHSAWGLALVEDKKVTAVDLFQAFEPGDTDKVLFTLEVLALSDGIGIINTTMLEGDDESGFELALTWASNPITVTEWPTVPGQTGPVDDTDGDGLADDFNENGFPDFADLVLLFVHMDFLSSTWALFDYDGSGALDFGDIQEYFDVYFLTPSS